MSPTGGQSGRRSAEVVGQLREWALKTKAGPIFDSSTGFKLRDGSVRSPDAAWVRSDRWHALTSEEQEAFPPLCPDAAFEILLRTDSIEELRAKMQSYAGNGTPIAVLVDPYGQRVELHRPNSSPTTAEYETVSLDPELPGFTLDLRAL